MQRPPYCRLTTFSFSSSSQVNRKGSLFCFSFWVDGVGEMNLNEDDQYSIRVVVPKQPVINIAQCQCHLLLCDVLYV